MDQNFGADNPAGGSANFTSGAQNLSSLLGPNEEVSNLSMLKSKFLQDLEYLDSKLKKEPTTHQEWQTLINFKNSVRSKLNTSNAEINSLLKKYSTNTNGVKYVQIQRFRSIFDQYTSELNNVGKQLDTKYQRFTLFNSPNSYYPDTEHTTKVIHTGKAFVEAIVDVESLTDQASFNLEILRRGNRRLTKIYKRVSSIVDQHMPTILKVQKGIQKIIDRNRIISSIIMGILIFLVMCKIASLIFPN